MRVGEPSILNLKKIIRRVQLGLVILALTIAAYIAITIVFWNVVMSYVLAALYLLAGAVVILLAGAFAAYVVIRLSRLRTGRRLR